MTEVRLETERLLMRMWRKEDFEPYARMCADPEVISLIHPENQASIRVAERLGEKVEGTSEILGMPVLVYGIDRGDSGR